MQNKIEIYEHSASLVRARLLYPRTVDACITLAPGDDPHDLLISAYARLEPSLSGQTDPPTDDPPPSRPVALQAWTGTAWRTL